MKTALTLVACLILASCASQPGKIGVSTDACCANDSYQTFTVTPHQIPAFLGPLMVSNFSVALAAKGLQPVETDGDLKINLRYEQDDLDRTPPPDGFDGRTEPGDGADFIARIVVEMFDANSGELVWSGSIQRLHHVSPGEYMHTGRASIALFDAFMEMLEHYPGKKE